MKRAGNLFESIVDRENLRLAFHKALRGKRDRRDAREFAQDLDRRLEEMAAQLSACTFPLGRFHQFVIHDPKERVITAPCFAERVLHHAVLNVCEPHFDRWLITDTYACRAGKGRIAALARAREFARKHTYFLKLDIRKYFDSISHEKLLNRLARRFKDRRVLDLFGRIVGVFRSTLGCGLPIGSLTSQHFANFYLGWFDRFLKETLRLLGYVRYMDDMAIWSNSKSELKDALGASRDFLSSQLGLTIKPVPYLNRTSHGMDYLGCRVHRCHLTLNRRGRRRFRRKLTDLERQHLSGMVSEREYQQRATAMMAFARAAGVSSWRFRRSAIDQSGGSGHKARTG